MMFNIKDIENAYIHETLLEVYEALEERGYNPTNQLVGYLISGDPGYISSYKNSRNKICKLDRVEILEILVDGYMKKQK
ncbi:MAG TPA: IreB family regulatory phosphoprotein [Bacilli bacterium]|nr:IreB family regulatory phosphoprotein [Bacilli bacterium]